MPIIDTTGLHWLEDRGHFSRFAVGESDSVWQCQLCESNECDPVEGVCYACGDVEA